MSLPGVKAALVRQGVAVERRRVRAAIELLGLDPDDVAAVTFDRHTMTIVYRSDKVTRTPIIDEGDTAA